MLRVEDVDDSLGGALLTLQRAEDGTQQAMRTEADAAITASWVPALTAAAGTAQQRKLLVSGAGADVTDLGFDLTAAAGGALSGGLDASHWYAVDYGMAPKQINAPNRKRTVAFGGRKMRGQARIWVGRNLPARLKTGRVVYPTIGAQSQLFVDAWTRGLLGQFDGSPLDVETADVTSQVAGSWR